MSVGKDVVFLSYPDFKTQIKEIRREAIELGYAISTMDGYERIWNKFIEWKQEEHFVYQEEDYNRFLLEIFLCLFFIFFCFDNQRRNTNSSC